MKIKSKSRTLVGVLAAILLAFTGVFVLLTGNNALSASAAITPLYTVMLNGTYTVNYGGYSSTSQIEDLDSFEATKSLSNAKETVSLTMSGSSKSGTAKLNNKGYINFSGVYFTASQTHYTLTIYDEYASVMATGTGSVSATLSDGLYKVAMTYLLSTGGGNTQFRMGFDLYCYFTVDTKAPTLSGASTSKTGKYTNSAFTITATDATSGIANLYWKSPTASSYSSITTSSKTISAGNVNGLYSFYAVDKAGNASSTYYVYYDDVAPTGKVTTSSGEVIENGGSTKESFSYTVTDSGSGLNTLYYKTPSSTAWKTYTAGTLIDADAEQGIYTFLATDKAGNSETYTVNVADPCADGHDYIPKVILPTCSTGGYTIYTCSRCGVSYTTDKTSALGHSYSAKTTAATCTSGGYTTYTCTRCNYSYTGNLTSATGHSYSSKTTAATCTSGGYTTYTCTRCGYSFTGNTTAALGHSYEAVTTSSSCTVGGHTTYKCSRCGISYTDSPTQATGHSYVASIVEATCTERGYTVFTCTKCGDTYRDNETAPLGHNYVSEVIAAACSDGGYTNYTCTRCGHSYTGGYTQPTGHTYVTTTVAANCTEGGYTLHTCSICGESYKDNVTQPLGHNFISSTREATCTQFGGTVYTCQVCGYEYSDNNGTYPKGHNYTTTIITSPTCTTEGLRRSVCDNCGDTYDTVIPANGHSYIISDVVSENGITTRTYTCTVCGETYKQELGDQYEEVSNYVEYLFEQYSPYMWWVLLAAAGIWSIVMGVFFAIAQKNEDKEKAKKMIINYVVGLVVIAIIVVACPYLIRGIAALVT